MTSVKKINQAACILSDFNFKDVSYCNIDFYFATEDGDAYGSSVNSYDEERFREWGKKEWRERILDSVRWYTERGYRLTHVASIIITFHTKDQDEKWDDPLYAIEMTDLTSGLFDRLITHSLVPNHFMGDVACTIKESSRIRGARDVVKLTRKIPRVRINKISTDLPRVLLAANSLL